MSNVFIPRARGAEAAGLDDFSDFQEDGEFADSAAFRHYNNITKTLTAEGVMFKFPCNCGKAQFRPILVSWPELACIQVGVAPGQLGLDPDWQRTNGGMAYRGCKGCDTSLIVTPADCIEAFQNPQVAAAANQNPDYVRVVQSLRQMAVRGGR